MEHEEGAGAPAWALAVEQSAFAETVRDSLWLYPAANLTHLLGLTLLVGSMVLLDLRLLGLARRLLPAASLSRYLTPFAVAGLALMVASGLVLFSADAGPLITNPVFRLKLLVIAAGIANAVAFRVAWQRRLPGWEERPPLLGRVQAGASLLLWLGAGTAGRLIAYF